MNILLWIAVLWVAFVPLADLVGRSDGRENN